MGKGLFSGCLYGPSKAVLEIRADCMSFQLDKR